RLAVEGVRLLRSREAGILADGPWPAGIRGRARPAHERLPAPQRVEVTDALQVVGAVERLDRNAFRRVPHQRVRGTADLRLGNRRPLLEVGIGPDTLPWFEEVKSFAVAA